MSYSVVSYLTNSEALKKLYASKDNELLSALREELSEELDDLNDDFDFDDNIGDGKNAQEVLTDIINGGIRFPELAYMYGYVYERLCGYYGAQIVPPDEEFSTNYYWAIPKQAYKAFIPIPFSSDFPEIYSIPASELQEEKDKFLALTKRDGVDEDYLNMEKENFAFVFDKAIESNSDLVFFLY